jgi:hypothetical protein
VTHREVYEVSYYQVTGPFTTGTDNDLLTSTGGLMVTATPGNRFRIRMHDTGSGPTLDPAAFQLEGDVFSAGSTIVLEAQGNDVFLTFSPVPEPTAVAGPAAGHRTLGRGIIHHPRRRCRLPRSGPCSPR